jgi:hypothetical protein
MSRVSRVPRAHVCRSRSEKGRIDIVPCEEKYRLLDLYKARVSAHSAAVNDITLTHGKTSKQEYDHLWDLAEKARRDSEASTLARYDHCLQHGC